MFARPHVTILRNRLSEPSRSIIALTGPRQVGKTTIVRQVLEEAQVPVIFESADGILGTGPSWVTQTWNNMRSRVKGSTGVLVFDEIQKVSDWSEVVKKEWDADTRNGVDIRVILLGSSTVLLNQGLRESLAGRFEIIRAMPWAFNEMREAFGFTLEQFAIYGGYPGAAPFVNDTDRWMSYINDSIIEPVVLRDIVQMQRIEKPALLKQLLVEGARLSSREVSLTKLASMIEDAKHTTTLSSYLQLLTEAGFLCGLNKYGTSVMKRKSVPKFQVYANAIATACGSGWNASMDASVRGRCYESMVGAHLLNSVQGTQIELSWWRDAYNEVDYVLSTPQKTLAIEVSTSANHKSHGLDAFIQLFPEAQTLIVGTGGVPFEEFLLSPLSSYF